MWVCGQLRYAYHLTCLIISLLTYNLCAMAYPQWKSMVSGLIFDTFRSKQLFWLHEEKVKTCINMSKVKLCFIVFFIDSNIVFYYERYLSKEHFIQNKGWNDLLVAASVTISLLKCQVLIIIPTTSRTVKTFTGVLNLLWHVPFGFSSVSC